MASATAHRSGIAGRLQFRLRTLLAAMLLVCLGLTFWSVYIRPYRQEARIIAQLQERGAVVTTETEGPVWLRDVAGDDFFRRIVHVELDDAKTIEEDLRLLASALPRRRLSVRCSELAPDAVLSRWSRYRQPDLPPNWYLEELHGSQYRARIVATDAGLRHLGRCKNLERLAIAGGFTDRGVRHLTGLAECRSLDLASVYLTDDSLAAVGSLTSLRELRLVGGFTDAGLAHLHPLTNLETLVVGDPERAEFDRITPTSVDLTDVPLVDVLEYLKDLHQLYLEVDEDELKAAGLDPTAPGAVKRIPLRDNLEQLLNPLGLDWKMGDYGIVITTAEAAAESRRGVTALQQRLPNLKNVIVPW